MPVITLSCVSFAHTAATPLFEEVDLQLEPGWTGLVGPNGAGKSTLLSLLDGSLEPDSGTVRCHPAGLRVRLCPQRVERSQDGVLVFAEASDGLSQRLRGELELRVADLARWDTLSPGERKRWQIGAALAAEPDALLLDEPTNHLDAEARELLERALRDHGGIGVLVSHDRGFLDSLTTRTMRCFASRVRLYRGSYAIARKTWEREERERDQTWDRLRHEERKLRRRMQSTRERRGKEAAKRRSAKGSASGIHAASSSFSSFRRRSPAISIARDMRVLNNAVDKVEGRLSEFRFEREHGAALFVDYQAASAPVLLSLRSDALRVPGRVLLRKIDVQVRRESRVRLTGANGTGKTTLLRALLESARIPREKLLWLPQDLSMAQEAALLASANALRADVRGRVLTVLAALGVDPDRVLASRRLSPGEARKLMLAFGLGRGAWGLLLDEPTNHLDLPSIERLEAALAAYPGALVVVSHDDQFARACTSTEWNLKNHKLN